MNNHPHNTSRVDAAEDELHSKLKKIALKKGKSARIENWFAFDIEDLEQLIITEHKQQTIAVLDKLLTSGHGGGNWRRLIISERTKLKGQS